MNKMTAAIIAEADENPRAVIGGNEPPVDAFDGFSIHIEDLLLEARNFLDGEGVQSQGQADAVSALLDNLRKAGKDADAARAAEKKPHDDAAKAVQAKWKPLIEKADTAVSVAKQALSPWLMKLEADKRAAAEAARREAEEAARIATEAMRAAAPSDLAAREAAEALVQEAAGAEKAAHKAEGEKAHAKGGARATGLRSYFTAEVTDARAALIHYANTNPDAIKGFVAQLAQADVAAGKRQIPGVTVHEERRVV